jgi:hypothetical protein
MLKDLREHRFSTFQTLAWNFAHIKTRKRQVRVVLGVADEDELVADVHAFQR